MTDRVKAAGCALMLGLSAQACADAPAYPALLADDIKHAVTAPLRWNEPEWQNFGLATLTVAGAAVLLDRPLRDAMRRQSGNSKLMREIEPLGAEYSAGVLGGFLLAGVAGNDRALAVAQDGFAASLIASGIVTPALKFAAGRSRPRQNAGIANFRPLSGASSFPSGHTTQAFAVASVIAAHYDETWMQCVSYTAAGLVGMARTYHDAHFASDVLAGALIGAATGRFVVSHNRPRRAGQAAWLPDAAPGRVGIRLAGSF